MNALPDPAGREDAELVAAIASAGDRAAFATLFQRYAGRVKAFGISGGLAPEVAEEVAQEVMVTVWRRASTYDPARASFATWLFTIARNRRIDHLRRVRRPEPDPEDPLYAPDPDPTPEQQALRESRDGQVRRAIAELSADQLEVVRLAFFAGLSHGEIAERLGAPLGTVKSRLRLSFKRLRRDLGIEFGEELKDD